MIKLMNTQGTQLNTCEEITYKLYLSDLLCFIFFINFFKL